MRIGRWTFGLAVAGTVLTMMGSRPVESQAPITPPPLDVRPPALLARPADDRPSEPLGLQRLKVEATVSGFLARTRVTMTFHNPHPRPLEGELVFPLPAGATVSGYALDIDGVLVDGSVVEKEEARIAFEAEQRRGVDPGLVEWVRGNNFRTRVWPIPARGTRTVRIEYVSELVSEGAGDARVELYHLPMRYPTAIAEAELRVEVVKDGNAAPAVRQSPLASFAFESWQDRFVAAATAHDVELKDDMTIALPAVTRESVRVEKEPDDAYYFAIDDFPKVPDPGGSAIGMALPPKRVGLLWDASLSRADVDRKRELAIVRAWLARLGNVEVVLTVFRNKPEAPRSFLIQGGDAGELLRALDGIAYDGATSLAGLGAPDVAYSVLVSDGLDTLASAAPRAAKSPVYAFCADSRADHALLRHFARASGGEYFDLARLTDDAVAAAIGAPRYALLSATGDPKAVADLLPSGAQPVLGRVTVTGRLLVPEATVTLRYGGIGLPATERTITLRQAGAGTSGLVAHVWAQQKVDELALQPERNHDELLALGRRFGIVTPGTSLLVLERLDQYLRYGIEPPASRAAMREQYRQSVATRDRDVAQRKVAKLDQVVASWQEHVQWWQLEFKPRPAPKKQMGFAASGAPMHDSTEQLEGGVTGGVEGGVAGGVVGGVVGGLPQSSADGSVARYRNAAPPAAPAPMESAMRAYGNSAPAQEEAKTDKDVAKPEPERERENRASISLKPWDPDTPYLAAMKKAGPEKAYATYLAERAKYADRPAFYLDCADFLLRLKQRDLGVRVLTSVLELKLEDARLLRVVAHRLQQIGELDLAVALFEKVLRLRPEEPQSPRDLALALSDRADALRARRPQRRGAIAADYSRALALLNDVVTRQWDGRFPDIETIALMEANRILAVAEREKLPLARTATIDPRLRKPLDVDVRIVLTWDTDNTDMDLWVTEPGGEKCYYGYNRTTMGGRLSHDFTSGYGPEEYMIHRGLAGAYGVQANFYGSRAASLTGPTTLQATVFTNYGRPNEKREALTVRLTDNREVVDVGSIRFEGAAPAATEPAVTKPKATR
jgi:hypothetical protein